VIFVRLPALAALELLASVETRMQKSVIVGRRAQTVLLSTNEMSMYRHFEPGQFNYELPSFRGIIFVVEAGVSISVVLAHSLPEELGLVPLQVTTGKRGLETAMQTRPPIMLIDYHLPDMTGLELYDQLHASKEQEPIPTIITFEGTPDEHLLGEITKRHLVLLEKPLDQQTFRDAVFRALDSWFQGQTE
jgi:CheY-like chemotaxis protein